jgi:hypothetical protein
MYFFNFKSLFFFSFITFGFHHFNAKGNSLYELKLHGKSVKSNVSVPDSSIINYDFNSYFRLYKNGEIDTLFNQVLDSFFLFSTITYEFQQVPIGQLDAWRNYKVQRIKKLYSSLIGNNNSEVIVDIMINMPFSMDIENVNKFNSEYWGMDSCAYLIENDVLILTVYSSDDSGLLRYPAKQLILDLKSHKRIDNISAMIKAKYLNDFNETVNKQLTLQLYQHSDSFNVQNLTILINHVNLEQLLNNSIINPNTGNLDIYILCSKQNTAITNDDAFLGKLFNGNLKFSDQYQSTSNFNLSLLKVRILLRGVIIQSTIIKKKYHPVLGVK